MSFRNIITAITHWFSLDYRSLAVARIFVGIFIAADMIMRLRSAAWFYSDEGFISRAQFLQDYAHDWSFSLYFAGGSLFLVTLLLITHGVLGLMLAAGKFTQFTTALLWIMTFSLNNRNWHINNAGDGVIRILLFIMIFIPWGKVWSLDSLKNKNDQRSHQTNNVFCSPWNFALFLQVFLIYFLSYLHKTSPLWRKDYTAVYYTGQLELYGTWIMRQIGHLPLFYKPITFFTIYLEMLGPVALMLGFLLIRPKWTWKLKTAICLLFISLHIGIIASMKIGIFPYYCISAWIMFLPSQAWDFLLKKPTPQKTINVIERSVGKALKTFSSIKEKLTHKYVLTIISTLSVLLFTFVVLSWNLTHFSQKFTWKNPQWSKTLARHFHLYQKWDMFSPGPLRSNIWIEVRGEFNDGSIYDLQTQLPKDMSSDKPTALIHYRMALKDAKWRKYLKNMSDNNKLTVNYAKVWCHIFKKYSPSLAKIDIIRHSEKILLDQKRSPVTSKHLLTYNCQQ